MKKQIPMLLMVLMLVQPAQAGFFQDLLGLDKPAAPAATDDNTVVRGLKEALAVGTERAVKSVSKQDGYFSNPAIKILVPEKVRTAADLLAKLGYREQVDSFVLSMNRAAEKAAPVAADHFAAALKEMTIEDGRAILSGGNTSATDYFQKKTRGKIYESFKPVVSDTMNQVGVTRSYKEMTGKMTAVPFFNPQSLDLDHYVTERALDGLFLRIGEEEKQIRTNPAARATELLKKVFGGS